MPMDKKRYPKNWKEIAHNVKEEADWHCKCCRKKCYEPDEKPVNAAFILAVHHLDLQPENCNKENLLALCSVCHIRLHGKIKKITKSGITNETKVLFSLSHIAILEIQAEDNSVVKRGIKSGLIGDNNGTD